ncbi:MAG: hypothetical protein MUC88_12990, partial [Planctomycetes bacterium]|nr:hypothetical protein [Planctomycetota bacterium]
DQTDVPAGFRLFDAWDFGPQPHRHCSYAYSIPFGLYALTTAHDPSMPVAADRSPWLASPAGKPKPFAAFRPDLAAFSGTAEQARQGNSISHGQDGQNVLFVDGHVAFARRSYCGLDQDNIYTTSSNPRTGVPWGHVPIPPIVVPANTKDSVLVHDPAPEMAAPPEAPRVDSRNLARTAVVATLDRALPEQKNAIWCATFQIAWDTFRQDVVGEPILVPRAAELADRLNRSAFPTGSIEEKSYYAVAGPVKDGIIERIQREMARRFPAEPMPTFDSRYRTLPDVFLAYAYLNVDVGFKHPFQACPTAFDFHDSAGARTPVTAFRTLSGSSGMNRDLTREQVEVLYHAAGASRDRDEFAVDLSRETQPYQVVLARMPRGDTLGGAVQALREKTAGFQNDPNYRTLRQLRSIDTLIVPDVLYRLTHHFEELLGKHLGNPKWSEHFFFDALQKIDFSLSRTGVKLKSEGRLAAAAGIRREVAKPRHLHFDRPFLICVQKREPNATPFFVMWVENAELMKAYEQ